MTDVLFYKDKDRYAAGNLDYGIEICQVCTALEAVLYLPAKNLLILNGESLLKVSSSH